LYSQQQHFLRHIGVQSQPAAVPQQDTSSSSNKTQ
jgi:hypothetical protein